MSQDSGLFPEDINVTPTHPLKEFFILVGGVVAILVGAFFVLGWFGGWIAVRLPADYEQKLGAAFLSAEENKEKNENLIQAETYVQNLLHRLTASIPEKQSILHPQCSNHSSPTSQGFSCGSSLRGSCTALPETPSAC